MKEQQKKLITEIMNEDAKDGLYKKQTAVEWLASKLGEYIVWEEKIIDLVEQAKEMHKQEIIDANEDASTNELGEFLTGEQYYNKEYGKQ
jgi:hypothetical protein